MSNEAALIAALRALAPHPAARGLADDAAVLEFGGEALVLTHDMMVEGVHWLPGQDPADVAYKLVAVNLSDLAAKGAEPLGVLLGYTLGPDDARFVAGLSEALAEFDVPLLGGDTVSAPVGSARAIGLTALGRATCQPVPSRGGAQVGDGVWVTGPLGGAMLGFEVLRDGASGIDTSAFRRPRPLLAQGRALAPLVSAMMDVSDGLLLDASRMALASGVMIALDGSAVPLAPGLPEARRHDALTWGDDYQLLFTAAPHFAPDHPATTRVGTVAARGPHPVLLDGSAPVGALGFQHGAL
ncbi:thiamine-phosphate kinase [Novosphingobium sp.]|uniref:thiamine-phosphate kinase n=1 Tax=Novosphingobium sp. TaxID=1874826 RepID=UPI0025D7073F|nr:thiamine-phosphate kinase [Novosphingobium sp.]